MLRKKTQNATKKNIGLNFPLHLYYGHNLRIYTRDKKFYGGAVFVRGTVFERINLEDIILDTKPSNKSY